MAVTKSSCRLHLPATAAGSAKLQQVRLGVSTRVRHSTGCKGPLHVPNGTALFPPTTALEVSITLLPAAASLHLLLLLLLQVVLNLDNLQSDPQAAAAFKGVDAVFCALGTTRAVSGSVHMCVCTPWGGGLGGGRGGGETAGLRGGEAPRYMLQLACCCW
jgi:hypothetical protein